MTTLPISNDLSDEMLIAFYIEAEFNPKQWEL